MKQNVGSTYNKAKSQIHNITLVSPLYLYFQSEDRGQEVEVVLVMVVMLMVVVARALPFMSECKCAGRGAKGIIRS
jgi:hypothetical protein